MPSNACPTRLARRPALTPLARAAAQLLSAAGLLAGPMALQAQAQALPSGLQIVQGQASVATQGAQMTVRNSNNAILNWQSFSIGVANQVRFEQASAASKVLNRVTGNDPSQILGSLSSNGQVWLLNPNGVIFGQGARIDVAGLVASALRLNDNDFLRGSYRFTALDGEQGLVRNEGAISTLASSNGGQVVLLGGRVENTGSIEAGQVSLAAARSVELVDTGLPHLSVKVELPQGEVLNLGRLTAPGGTINVYGAIVNQQGLVQADSLGSDAQGRIVLKASDTLTLAEGSRTQALGTAGAGGQIDLLGDKVALVGHAQVDASGEAGGGRIRVGGGLQGQDSSVSNASAVFFGPQASIRADASGGHGDGGTILMWSNEATRAYGSLSARGGSLTGNGGFVETSGGWLDARPTSVDVSATAGLAGSWLLDPNNITVTNTGPNTNISTGPNFTSTGDSSVLSAATIASALNAGTSVTISTGIAGSNSQAGDIVVSGVSLSVKPTVAVGLTLRARRDILITNSSLVTTGSALSLDLVTGVGATVAKGAIEIRNSTITTRGGNVKLGGSLASQMMLPGGFFTAGIFTPAVGYDPALESLGSQLNNPRIGVNIRNNSVLTLGSGNFTATGLGTSASGAYGIGFGSGSMLSAANVTLNGFNNAPSGTFNTPGVAIVGSSTLAAITATSGITIFGAGADGVHLGFGAQVTLNAPGNAAAIFDLTGNGADRGVYIGDQSLTPSPPYAGTPIAVIGGSLSVVGSTNGGMAGILLEALGASSGLPTAPSINLSAATGAVLSSVGNSNSYLLIDKVRIAGPATGTVSLRSSGSLFISNSAYLGAGTLDISGNSLNVHQSSIAASGGLLNLGFATTGSSPTGLTIDRSNISTNGGDLRFGNLQQVCSPALGCSTVDGYWLQAGGNFGANPLAILSSSMNAGSGRIYGGGAVLASSNSSPGVVITNSTLSANQISLAGNSESNHGLQMSGSTLTANQVLKLDGLTGATAGFGSGVYLASANTLRVNASFDDPNAQLVVLGETRGPGGGVQVYGGDPATNNQTLISATGADLRLQGTAPASYFGLALDGSSSATGALSIVGASNRTMHLSGSGLGVYLSRVGLKGSGTLNLSGTGVTLSEASIAAQNGPLDINFATTGANLRGVIISLSTLTTLGGSVRLGAVQTVCTVSLGCTTASAPWLETDTNNALFIGQTAIDAGAGNIFGGGSQRGAAPNNDSVTIVSSSLKAATITLSGRAESNAGINLSNAELRAVRTLTLDGISGATSGSGSGLYLATGTRLLVNDPGNQLSSALRLRGESRGSGTGLLVYGGDPASNGQSLIEATGAQLSMTAIGTGSYDGLYLAGLNGLGSLVISVSNGRTADLSASGAGNYLDKVSFRGTGTLNIAGPNTSLVDSAITAIGGAMSVSFATTGANPGGVDIARSTITTGGGDVRFGAVQQVCSPGLGCTTVNGPWLEAGASGTYSPLSLEQATIDAGSGRIYGGGAMRDPASQSPGIGLYGSQLSAAEIDLSGRSDTADGLRMIGGTLTATRKLTLNGLSASSLGYENGLSIYEGSTLRVADPASSAGSALTLSGESRGAGPGLQASGGTSGTNPPTLIQASGAALLMSGLSQGAVGMKLYDSGSSSAGGLRIDGQAATRVQLSGQTKGSGQYGLLMDYAQVLGPNAGQAGTGLALLATGAGAGSYFSFSANNSSLSSVSPLAITADGILLSGSTVSSNQSVSLLSGPNVATGSPVLVQNSTLSTSATGALMIIGATNGVGMRGKADLNGGRGIDIQNSTLQNTGVGSLIELVGTGSNGGGDGVSFSGTQMLAAGIQIRGTGTNNANGVFSDAGTSTGIATSLLRAVDLGITGRSNNGDGTSPQYAGVRLGSAVELAFNGRGTASISGDYVALGATSSTPQNLKIGGNAASLTVSSTESMRLRNSTLDFGTGASTNITLRGDSDGLNGGRTRFDSTTINTGGGNFTASGVGVIVGLPTSPSPNQAVNDGSTGLYMASNTVNAGAGAVTLTGSGANGAGLSESTGGVMGLATYAGTTHITARSITLNGNGGAKGVGIAIGADPQGNTNNSVLNLTADTITINATGVGVTPGTEPRAYEGLILTGASNWKALNGTLSINSVGPVSLTGPALSATGQLRIQADGLALQTGTTLSSTRAGDAVVLTTASGTFVNTAGSGVLAAPNGRWLLLLANAAGTQLGGLTPAFSAYGLATNPWQTDGSGNLITPAPGNGVGFATDAGSLALVSGLLTKVYDGTRNLTLDPQSWFITGLLGSDRLTFTGSSIALLADKNVGSGKAVTLDSGTSFSVVGASGQPVFGYAPPTFTANVTAATLTVTGLVASNKVYDSNTVATLLGGSVTPLAGDTVSVSPASTGRFADKNVGLGKSVTVNGLTLAGADAGNYVVAPVSPLLANITARPVSLTGLSAANKVYDATTAATLQGSVSVTALAGDLLALSGTGSAVFVDKNVGSGKVVTVTGYTLSGADAGNYSLLPPTGLLANITPRNLIVTGLTAANKVYDATTTATLTGTASVTPLTGDSVTLAGTASGRYADKNVGIAKPVQVTGYALSGADAGNYLLVAPAGLVADIKPRSMTIGGLSVANKVYDATVDATLLGNASVGALAGDDVALGGSGLARFTDKNVGTAKFVSVTGYTLAGTDAGNYQLQASTGLLANITARPVSLTGLSAANKVYDATTAATLQGSVSVTALAGDLLGLSGTGSAAFVDKNVGSGKVVTASGYTLSGADAGNYSLLPPTGLLANITPRNLIVTGLTAANKVYDATTTATLSGTASVTPLAGDGATLAGTASGRYADKNVGIAKPVLVTGYTLSGADAGNYLLVAPAGLTSNISAALLTLNGLAAASRVYDGTDNATVSATLGGAYAGDTVASALNGRFVDKNAGTAKLVNYSAQLSGADAGNYTLGSAASGTVAANITPRNLSYVADPQVGNALSPLPLLTGTVTGFVTGDNLAGSTTGLLSWVTPATLSSPPGSYAINGTGLSSINYSFVQALGNATALTLGLPLKVDLGTESNTTTNNTTVGVSMSLQQVQVQVQMSTPTEGRVLDAVPALASSATPTLESTDGSSTATGERATTQAAPDGRAGEGGPPSGVTFRSMNFQRMPRDEIQTVLAARAGFKKQVFATGVFKIEQDPSLADVRGCRSAAELSTGNCLITEQLKKEIQAAAQAQPRRTLRKVKQTVVPNIERKLALLIGVNKYKDQRVPELVGAVPDARAVKDLLEQRLGYEATVVEDPSREAIVRAFNKLALDADANDSVIIYYAGHGVVVPLAGVDTGFWLPSDSNAEEPSTWLSNADIARLVTAIGARQLMLVSDSCYSGSLAGSERVQLDTQFTDPSELLKRKAVVVMSSGGNEPVADEGREGHSIFAWHLMQSLKGLDSWQVGGSVFERVRTAVVKEFPQTPQYGAQRSAGHQGNTDYVFERREFEPAAPN